MTKPTHPKPRARKAITESKYRTKATMDAFEDGYWTAKAIQQRARKRRIARRGREMVWEDLETDELQLDREIYAALHGFVGALVVRSPPSLWERVRGALRLINHRT